MSSSFYNNLSDSVENSFCDKLVSQASRQQMDQAEPAVFKMLETAADDKNSLSSHTDEDCFARHRENSGLATLLNDEDEDSFTSQREAVLSCQEKPGARAEL